jgi:hypothetical protein
MQMPGNAIHLVHQVNSLFRMCFLWHEVISFFCEDVEISQNVVTKCRLPEGHEQRFSGGTHNLPRVRQEMTLTPEADRTKVS